MNAPKVGALFAGYGGLDMAVEEVFGGRMAWYSEIDRGALKILGHRFPAVPNVGSVTEAEWSQVEPVDILTGGSPCQDLSHAGRRAGMTQGTRSNLWVAMREAIAQLRPSVVVWENVRGAYSAGADSALVHNPRLLADVRPGRGGGPVLRALGRVLGDLSDLGYDCRWHGLRAADVGAPHGRFRVFVVATDTSGVRGHEAVEHDGRRTPSRDWAGVPHESDRDALRARPNGSLLPTPSCSDTNGAGAHGAGGLDLRTAVSLLPTPAVNDMGRAYTPETWDAWCATQQAKHGNGNGHGKSLEIEAQRLFPTPTSADSKASGAAGCGGNEFCTLTDSTVRQPDRWGDYAAAIARWERVLGRPAPAPTMTSAKGNPQLSPAFVNWMMGLPAGWVDQVPGITRNEALKALGNGVVPQQAGHALRTMLAWEQVAA